MYKGGQVALFVIIAIVIVGVFLAFFLYPRISVYVTNVDPSAYVRACIQPEIQSVVPVIAQQGGYHDPTHYVMYRDIKIQYLCYTDENYKPCIVQQPLLVNHVENEIKARVQPKARACMQELKTIYERKGYIVSAAPGDINVSIVPGSINVVFLSPLTVSKESTQTFRSFIVSQKSELYNLLGIATSIVQFESTLGDSETTLYIQYYPDLQIEKLRRDADTIYTLRNVVTKDNFVFATRSLVWPQGYGFIQKT